jgi:hypothetical protein
LIIPYHFLYKNGRCNENMKSNIKCHEFFKLIKVIYYWNRITSFNYIIMLCLNFMLYLTSNILTNIYTNYMNMRYLSQIFIIHALFCYAWYFWQISLWIYFRMEVSNQKRGSIYSIQNRSTITYPVDQSFSLLDVTPLLSVCCITFPTMHINKYVYLILSWKHKNKMLSLTIFLSYW